MAWRVPFLTWCMYAIYTPSPASCEQAVKTARPYGLINFFYLKSDWLGLWVVTHNLCILEVQLINN